jgi:hypothetical protein
MKQKRQLGILIVLVLIAAGVWFWNFQGGKTIITDVSGDTRKYPPLNVDNPTLRMYEVERARKAEYKSSGRNIFSYIAATPAVAHPHVSDPVILKMPCGIESGPCLPPPPEPPKLPPNIKYFGFGVVPNGTSRRAFFHDTNGDQVYVVAEGEVLLNRYRILRIGNQSLEFEEISTGRMGTAPLEEQGGGPPQ